VCSSVDEFDASLAALQSSKHFTQPSSYCTQLVEVGHDSQLEGKGSIASIVGEEAGDDDD
jgi:hypothetical protein